MPLNQETTLRDTEENVDDDVLKRCGPRPKKPNYYSTQAERDAWIEWKLCKEGG